MTSTDQNQHFKHVVSFGTSSAFAPNRIDSASTVGVVSPEVPAYQSTGPSAITTVNPPLVVLNSDQILYVADSYTFTTGLLSTPTLITVNAVIADLGLTTGSSVSYKLYVGAGATLTYDFKDFVTNTGTVTVTYVPSPAPASFVGPGFVTVTFTAVNASVTTPSLTVSVTVV